MGKDISKLAEKLLALREDLRLSRKQAAEESGVSVASLMAYEQGRQQPSCENLVRLARLYLVPADYLLFDEIEDSGMLVDLSPLNSRDRRTVRELAQILMNDYYLQDTAAGRE